MQILTYFQLRISMRKKQTRYSERWLRRLLTELSLENLQKLLKITWLWSRKSLETLIFQNTFKKFQLVISKNGFLSMIKMSSQREFISLLERFIQSFLIKRPQTKLTLTSSREEELRKYHDSIRWSWMLHNLQLEQLLLRAHVILDKDHLVCMNT